MKANIKIYNDAQINISKLLLEDGVLAVAADTKNIYLGDGFSRGGIKISEFLPPYKPTWYDVTDDEFQNDWKNYDNGYTLAGYSINRDGLVSLKGLIYDGETDKVCFILPESLRPQKAVYINDVVILSSGEVYPKASYTKLDGVHFYKN